MKKLVAVVSFLLLTAAVAVPAHADGCYICAGGGYARYRGSDTFAKRKEAQRKCGCKVTGTTSKCSNPKCTVSYMGLDLTPLVKAFNRHLGLGIDICAAAR